MSGNFNYPPVRRDENIEENYHGMTVKDPYRWLEIPESYETQAFIEAQNNVTLPYIHSCVVRDKIEQRLINLWNFPKYSCPTRVVDRYYFSKNNGLQNQSVIQCQKTLEDEGVVFFDPNKLSEDGTVSLNGNHFRRDGKVWVYGLSKSGSDWKTIHFKNTITGENYEDVLKRVKFSFPKWTRDNLGVFYSKFPDQEGETKGSSDISSNINQKIYYHRLGTKQSEDTLMVEFLDNPNWMVRGEVSTCGKFLIVEAHKEGRENLLFISDLTEPIKNGLIQKLELLPIISKFEAEYSYITNDGNVMLIKTNKNAPNYKLIIIDLSSPQEENWTTLLAEDTKNVLNWVAVVNRDKLMVCYTRDVTQVLQLHRLNDGMFLQEFGLEMGTVVSFSSRSHDEIFFKFSSYVTPGRIYRIDFKLPPPWQAQVLRETTLSGFDPNLFQTTQIFYDSKDGTKVPMFIVSKKGVNLDGNSPCLLYGYGGFNISIRPNFSVSRLLYMLHFNVIYASANIRGGGEYGRNWHNGGRVHNKQNCFDDFAAGAEYLIANKYTCPNKLAIQGGSNGGLLVGASINQRPELFRAAIAQVGVFDMLRYHKFTIGYVWSSDYGCSRNEDEFKTLIKYSPLHNIKPPQNATQYPALLVLTGDHDDRVVPSHSYKYIAEIQHKIGGLKTQTNPLMIRIETNAGHGDGKPTAKVIQENTDLICFLVKTIGLEADGI